jgi:ribosome-binding factor A
VYRRNRKVAHLMAENIRFAEEITHRAAEFVQSISNHTALLTVTRTILNEGARTAVICVTVYPREKEPEALALLKRQKTSLIQHLNTVFKRRNLPRIDIVIDEGEKHRQDIDTLLEKSHEQTRTKEEK